MTDRERAARELLARAKATGRRVYGFGEGKASCAEVARAKDLGDELTHLCAEGDRVWTRLPDKEPEQAKE